MIYTTCVFTRGGLVLWKKDSQPTTGDPTSHFVRDVLLQDKADEVYHTKDQQYTIRWTADNQNQLVFVSVIPQGFLHKAPFLPKLLDRTRSKFVSEYIAANKDEDADYTSFDEVYEKIYRKTLADENAAQNAKLSAPRSFEETSKGKKVAEAKKSNPDAVSKKEKEKEKEKEAAAAAASAAAASSASPATAAALRGKGRRRGTMQPMTTRAAKPKAVAVAPTKRTKTQRVWEDDPNKPTNITMDDDSFSTKHIKVETFHTNLSEEESESDDEELSDDSDDESAKSSTKKTGFFGRFIPSFTGKTLDEAQLESIKADFKLHLTTKNVTSEIAEKLVDSVGSSLVGKQVSSFASIKPIVREALKSALVRILTPKKEIDVLRDIALVNEKGMPYSIAFVGVNGVGKSTSLSKVCSWLLQNNLKVMIAACDTFRSGAVEQLKVHATRLDVDLFEQGYGKDASGIAGAAIRKAKDTGINVVLIDTAGRMQDNEPLMKSLSTLVHQNSPNLVLFVGEALVGHDGVHQLTNFNRSLELLSRTSGFRMNKDTIIDGVVLTKFDTIDDKVGAAVSMVYSTGIPIMFVGVGQHYTDLKKLNVDTIVKALLK